MPEVRMRPKHQITLPARIVREAQLETDDKLTVTYINGSIVITPQQKSPQATDIMAFAGIARGLWGNTEAQTDQMLKDMKTAWQR